MAGILARYSNRITEGMKFQLCQLLTVSWALAGVVLDSSASLFIHLSFTSSFRRPPGVGAELEKGAPPPFDPPDLVPRFARPNPELASLALCCFDQEM